MGCFDRSYITGGATTGGMGWLYGQPAAERRRAQDKDAHHLDAHFHSVPEQRAMTRSGPPFHDLERIARQSTGYVAEDIEA